MVIYKFTNNKNGKVYVGQTSRNLEDRTKEHFYESNKNCKALRAAIKKYGKENFSIEVLDSANSLEELNEKEIFYINLHKSNDRKFGYNLTKGGRSLSVFNKNGNGWTKNRDERAKAMSLRFKGTKCPEKSKIRASEVNSLPTVNLTTGKCFKSAKEMAKFYNLTYTYVIKLLNGHARQKNCEIFRYQDLNRQKEANIRMSFVPLHKALPKVIKCLQTGEIFESIKIASEKTGILRTAISNNLSGRSKKVNGLNFIYWESKESNGEII